MFLVRIEAMRGGIIRLYSFVKFVILLTNLKFWLENVLKEGLGNV